MCLSHFLYFENKRTNSSSTTKFIIIITFILIQEKDFTESILN